MSPLRRLARLLPALLALPLAAAPAGAQSLTATEVASGLSDPLFLCSPPGDAARLFVIEKPGRIRIIENGVLLATSFLDVNSIASGGSEQGLLGMAFHPDYASNGRFYISYTDNGGDSVVREYLVSANPNVADAASFTVIFGPLNQPYTNHNGGCIQFGPDGMLYYGLGDGGSGNDPGNRAQNLTLNFGKMLRLDVDNPGGSYVPADNPFVGGSSADDLIWAYGLRNPWRFSFDRLTGDLYIGDVGQNAREEIDFQPASSTGGENYGWRCMEGFNCTGLSGCTCNGAGVTLPAYDRATYSLGGCSITGGVVCRAPSMPLSWGRYFFSDACSGRVWSFVISGGTATGFIDHTSQIAIPGSESTYSWGEDAAGNIYMCDASGGQVWRIGEQQVFTQRCFCDAASAPCSNPYPDGGCENSTGVGATLSATGSDTIVFQGPDPLTLHFTNGRPNKNCVWLQGAGPSVQTPFRDGNLCVGNPTLRLPGFGCGPFPIGTLGDLGQLSTDDATYGFDILAAALCKGDDIAAAAPTTREYQLWYRDGMGPCNTGSNLSNSVVVNWQP